MDAVMFIMWCVLSMLAGFSIRSAINTFRLEQRVASLEAQEKWRNGQ